MLRCALILALTAHTLAGFTMDEALAIHPDGTPLNPEAFRDALRSSPTDDIPGDWMQDSKLLELVASDDLDAFTDYIREVNHDRIFDADGSALDIKAWRQSVRDDAFYGGLLKQHFEEFYNMILSGTDEQVQSVLRAQQAAAVAEARGGRHDEL